MQSCQYLEGMNGDGDGKHRDILRFLTNTPRNRSNKKKLRIAQLGKRAQCKTFKYTSKNHMKRETINRKGSNYVLS